jgi:hypothetical protein
VRARKKLKRQRLQPHQLNKWLLLLKPLRLLLKLLRLLLKLLLLLLKPLRLLLLKLLLLLLKLHPLRLQNKVFYSRRSQGRKKREVEKFTSLFFCLSFCFIPSCIQKQIEAVTRNRRRGV